jgi:hypothetical protein
MFFLMPKEARPLFDVFPDQNHLEHIAKMEEFFAEAAETGVELQPDQLEDLLKHQQKHQGYLYGQLKGIIPIQQIPTPPLEARQDNPMGNGSIEGELSPTPDFPIAQELGASPFGGGTTTSN